MGFTNSPLVEYTRISPNKNDGRWDWDNNKPITKITKITIHHWAGVGTLETFGNIVANPSRQMSANYAIDKDARVGLFCEEKDRSWCSSSKWNDNQAVTIEVSNSQTGEPWPISDKVLAKLIDLCVDICKRNGISKLTFTGDRNGSLTYHYMFAQTSCPEAYIRSKTNYICNEVNKRLNPPSNNNDKPASNNTTVKAGDLVSIKSGAVYYNGGKIPDWVASDKWYVASVSGDRAVLGKNVTSKYNIQSPIKTSFLTVVNSNTNGTTVKKEQTVSLKASDLIYNTAGGKAVSTVGANGVYTITESTTINGSVYGKLKSGAGWVIISGNVPSTDIVKGSIVSVTNPVIYGTNKKFIVLVKEYTVLSVSGDRCVISADGKNVTAAIAKKYLKKIR